MEDKKSNWKARIFVVFTFLLLVVLVGGAISESRLLSEYKTMLAPVGSLLFFVSLYLLGNDAVSPLVKREEVDPPLLKKILKLICMFLFSGLFVIFIYHVFN